MLSESQLKKLDALSLRLRDVARGSAGGARRSRLLGSSAEFSDFREYMPGDDLRRIDWNAYARFDRLFLKLFMEEQESVVHIHLDGSTSMRAKWGAVLQMAQMIGYLALVGGDRVRLNLLTGGEARHSALFSGRKDFMPLCAFSDAIVPGGETRLGEALPRVPNLNKGLSVLISDLFSADGYEKALLSLLFRKQEVVLIHLLSPEEMNPALEGAVRLVDSENGEKIDLLAGGEAMRRYRDSLAGFLREAESFCHGRAIAYLPAVSHEGAAEALLRALMAQGTVG